MASLQSLTSSALSPCAPLCGQAAAPEAHLGAESLPVTSRSLGTCGSPKPWKHRGHGVPVGFDTVAAAHPASAEPPGCQDRPLPAQRAGACCDATGTSPCTGGFLSPGRQT